ncbi:unnamed protein product, partial [marine sediment metagenome]
GKIFAIQFPIMAFVVLGFEHSVANMFFIPAGMFITNEISWRMFLLNNLLPVTLGNIVGGVFFVGMLYYYIYGKESRGRRWSIALVGVGKRGTTLSNNLV